MQKLPVTFVKPSVPTEIKKIKNKIIIIITITIIVISKRVRRTRRRTESTSIYSEQH